ncbi:hypothetical protein ACTFIU_001825 [Dictyostelium citrinum]
MNPILEDLLINDTDKLPLDSENQLNDCGFQNTQNPLFQEIKKLFFAFGSGDSTFNFSPDIELIDLIKTHVAKNGLVNYKNSINCFKSFIPNYEHLPASGLNFVHVRIFDPISGMDFKNLNDFKIKVNGDNIFTSKNKYPTSSSSNHYQIPVDISEAIFKSSVGKNITISVKFPKNKQGIVIIQLVKFISPERIISGKVRRYKFSTTKETDDDDKLVNNTKISLLCPITKQNINVPAKFKKCDHDQCFDLRTYYIRGIITRNWKCPICKKSNYTSDLFVDRYFFNFICSRH